MVTEVSTGTAIVAWGTMTQTDCCAVGRTACKKKVRTMFSATTLCDIQSKDFIFNGISNLVQLQKNKIYIL
jgi:hypothetical protein